MKNGNTKKDKISKTTTKTEKYNLHTNEKWEHKDRQNMKKQLQIQKDRFCDSMGLFMMQHSLYPFIPR